MKSIQETTLSTRPILFLMGLVAVALIAGCSILRPQEDPTRFYVLTVPKAAIEVLNEGGFRRLSIGLKPLEMPSYLRTKSMVVRTGSNEVSFEDFDRWAEPLDQGIARILKENLGGARNVAKVTLNSHGEDTLDCEVEIRILACEGVRTEMASGSIRFAATWEIRSTGNSSKAAKQGRFTANRVPWDGTSYSQLAERLSEAIANASTAISTDLPTEPTIVPGGTTKPLKP